MKVALYNVNVVPGDATGNALLAKLNALRAAGMETRLYTPHTMVQDEAIVIADDVSLVEQDAFHLSADVHVFEYGWTYELFDLLPKIRPPARTIVSFHGITPRALMSAGLQPGIDATKAQLRNARHASTVLVASDYARAYLVRHGVANDRIRTLPLPVRLPHVPRRRAQSGVARFLFVGRTVPSKGLLDLVRALAALRRAGAHDWELSIVSNPAASDARYAAEVLAYIRDEGLEANVAHVGAVESLDEMAALYASTDAVIIPTYHETYCLPLLEALASGCAVVAYGSGAIPEIAAGLARLVQPGSVDALHEALSDVLAGLPTATVPIADGAVISRSDFEARARARTRDLTGERYDAAFLALIREADVPAPAPPSWLARQLARWRGASS